MNARRLALAAALALASPAVAAPALPVPHTIAMTGVGTASARPDRANVYAGVVTHGRTAAAAMQANRDVMNKVFDALTALGIPKNQIETASFSLEPQYPPEDPKDPRPREINGYEVSNSVNVTLTDVTQTGAALDALIDAGANQSAGVSFSVHDSHPLEVDAKASAARDALERAQIYVRTPGVALGPVISIREGSQAVIGNNVETVVVTAERRATPIAEAEQSVEAEVTVVWELK